MSEIPRVYKIACASISLHAPAQLYRQYRLPIKATDLAKLAILYVPANVKNMYIGLPTMQDDSEGDNCCDQE